MAVADRPVRRERYSFSKIADVLDVPNLIEIQQKSYQWFLDEGLMETFGDITPVQDFTGNLVLEFTGYSLGEPKYEVDECKQRDVTYAAPLKVKVRLINKETGEVKEQEVFMGDFPLMTDKGTFIINGAERVIVSQLVRSPGVYFDITNDPSGKTIYSASIIPNRGAWLEFETDASNVIYVRVDRTRKVPATVLLRALGYGSSQSIIEMFDNNEYIMNTIEKDPTNNADEALIEIYKKLRPGEPPTAESARSLFESLFFDPKRYDLASVGRYKTNKKLALSDRLIDKELSRPLVNPETGEIIVQADEKVTRRMASDIKDICNEANIKVAYVKPLNENDPDIKVIGNGDQPMDLKTIVSEDVVAAVNYLVNLPNEIGTPDDIDHLGNRRLKSVGELLQNQFRIGLSRMERVIRERMTIQDVESVTPQALINIRPVVAAVKEFFGSSQLSQFMDQTNPLAELTHKRRLSALGPGGLSREGRIRRT